MSSTGSFLTVLLFLFFFDGAVAPRPFLVLRQLAEVSMMAKEWKERLELLECSVESLMDDEEMRSGSLIRLVLISISAVDC